MLRVDIEKKFDKITLSAAFQVDKDFFGIIGASGAGKSMMLKCIAGIEKPDRGKIVLDDKILFDSEKKINLKPQERHIGYLFQNFALFPQMTVWENVYVAVNKKYYKSEDSDKVINSYKTDIRDSEKKSKDRRVDVVNETLEMLNLKGFEKKYPGEISGGEQQRVALARIIVNEPEFLLLDEPFSSLDTYLKYNLSKELKDIIKKCGKGMIFVTHNISEIQYFCEDLAVLSEGRIVEVGKVKDIIANPRSEEGKELILFSDLNL